MAKKQKKIFFGVGVDIEDAEKFKGLAKNKSFLNKVFTKRELSYCFKKKFVFSHLAARYAGKEAAIKAINSAGVLKTGLWNLKNMEIYNTANGAPKIKFALPELMKLRTKISLAHSGAKAIAVVMVSGK